MDLLMLWLLLLLLRDLANVTKDKWLRDVTSMMLAHGRSSVDYILTVVVVVGMWWSRPWWMRMVIVRINIHTVTGRLESGNIAR
jgi:hypothetical protein